MKENNMHIIWIPEWEEKEKKKEQKTYLKQ